MSTLSEMEGTESCLDRVEIGLALGGVGDMLFSLRIVFLAKGQSVCCYEGLDLVVALQDFLSLFTYGIDHSVPLGLLLLLRC